MIPIQWVVEEYYAGEIVRWVSGCTDPGCDDRETVIKAVVVGTRVLLDQ